MLVGALLLFVAVLAGKVAYRFGAPALLLFLGVGMLFGLDFISYRSVDIGNLGGSGEISCDDGDTDGWRAFALD